MISELYRKKTLTLDPASVSVSAVAYANASAIGAAQNYGSCRRLIMSVLQDGCYFRVVCFKSQSRCQVIGVIDQVDNFAAVILEARQLQLF